jgi:hypothetical protein
MATLRSLLFLALSLSTFIDAQSKFTIQYPPASPAPAAAAVQGVIAASPAAPATVRMAPFQIEITPESSKATKPTIGLVGVWTVGICNNSPSPATITRTAILVATGRIAPGLHVLPDALAEDLMTRKAGTSRWSVLAAAAKEVGVIVPLAIAADGITANSKTTAYAALGAAVGMYLVSRATARVPNPTPYFAELLPASLTLGALQCSATPYLLIADLIKQPGTISLNLTVPQLP